jgi:APA family basic amino acid/polyamine antiporter
MWDQEQRRRYSRLQTNGRAQRYSPMMPEGALIRQLTRRDAVVVGAGSMIGAGVFTAWTPATAAAGTGALIGLVIAGAVAMCNATSSAQLAARHPESGGTYLYGRVRLNPLAGFVAGWGFVIGKLASSAAVALTIGAYLWPEQMRAVAITAVVVVTAINIGGLSRTAKVTRWLLVISVTTISLAVISGWAGSDTWFSGPDLQWELGETSGLYGVLQSAGFMFFAFAGYARIATLGEEVIDPATTIPYAIPRALTMVLGIYVIVGISLMAVLGPSQIAATESPVRAMLATGPLAWAAPILQAGVAIAAAGVLLNLVPGISRTMLAMARHGDLPRSFAQIHVRRSLPLRAELTVVAVIILLILMMDLRGAIGFSGVAILTYYAITNAAALKLSTDERRWSPVVAIIGLIGCVVLAVTLPISQFLIAVVVGVAGLIWRQLLQRHPR